MKIKIIFIFLILFIGNSFAVNKLFYRDYLRYRTKTEKPLTYEKWKKKIELNQINNKQSQKKKTEKIIKKITTKKVKKKIEFILPTLKLKDIELENKIVEKQSFDTEIVLQDFNDNNVEDTVIYQEIKSFQKQEKNNINKTKITIITVAGALILIFIL